MDFRVKVVTWNTGTAAPPANTLPDHLDELLQPSSDADLVVLNLQEVHARLDKFFVDNFVNGEDPWTGLTTKLLAGKGFIRLKCYRMIGTVMSVFLRRKHLTALRDVDTSFLRLSLKGFFGMKGAVALRFRIYGVSMVFVNAHLCAHDQYVDYRIAEYNNIIENLTFANVEETPNILFHDYVVFAGDLNFRLTEGTFDAKEIQRFVRESKLSELLDHDQLQVAKSAGMAFTELEESKLEFPPTYKFAVNSDDYDLKRRPAWTDRILWRCNIYNYDNFNLGLKQLSYSSHPSFSHSDHKPVSAGFELRVFDLESAVKVLKANPDEFKGPIVTFIPPSDWEVGDDARIQYSVQPGASSFVGRNDWIGLFRSDFTSLEDFCSYAYASSNRQGDQYKLYQQHKICSIIRTETGHSADRLTAEIKETFIADSGIAAAGKFVLIYFGKLNGVYGISQEFEIRPRRSYFFPIEGVPLASEAALNQE